MATPGDPFDTEDREQLRSEQRRLMRHLDAWLIQRAAGAMRPLKIDGLIDTDVLEDVVRVEAQRMVEAQGATLSRLGDVVRTGALQRFLNQNTSEPGVFGGDPLAEWRLGVSRRSTSARSLPDEEADALIDLVVLLIWADQLADDDYLDPRFSSDRTMART